jgi:AraC-like DNA-binding protein
VVPRDPRACPRLRRPDATDQIFVDHLTIAAVGHTLKNYGVGCRATRIAQTALAPWQERRAKELLSSRLDGNIFISDLATECGLPTSVFLRAFRQSTGFTPHRWLIEYRVQQAKQLLARSTDMRLDDIAQACGFANQTHLVRVFKRITGLHPEMWRHR